MCNNKNGTKLQEKLQAARFKLHANTNTAESKNKYNKLNFNLFLL
jgi:hypothetical protein